VRLDDLTPAHVRRAVELYLGLAYPPDGSKPGSKPGGEAGSGAGARARRVADELASAVTVGQLFEHFEVPRHPPDGRGADDLGDHVGPVGAHRYDLRLGNARYPFMKFVVQEYLVDEEYFFTVDTHDKLDVRPGAPDYDRWLELKRFNRELKQRIEDAWREAGLPTFDDLETLCRDLAPVERERSKRRRLLLVDDERSVVQGLGALLEARGYEIELAYTGEQVLERLARDPLPDLLMLDYDLPALDGEQVLDRLRSEPRTAELPVLMATASSIELGSLRRVSGLLRKPYPRGVLFAMLRQLLNRAHESPTGAGDGGPSGG
jgi:CheY-like chemotaxis protein